jgi:hypothetical protein
MKNKIAHFYWGGGPLSFLQHLTIVSFKKHNPNWKIFLWMPKVINPILPTWETVEQVERYIGQDYLEETKKLCKVKTIDFEKLGASRLHEVQKSDFIRWHILYKYGGVWSDMDILYVKPLPDLEFDATVCYDGEHHLIGFYMAEPEQQLYLDIFEEAKNRIVAPYSKDYQFLGSRMLKSMFFGIMTLNKVYSKSKILNLPMDLVYSYTSDQPDVEELFFGSEDRTTKNTIGIHWFNGHPFAKKYQNDFAKYNKNDSVVSKYVRPYV